MIIFFITNQCTVNAVCCNTILYNYNLSDLKSQQPVNLIMDAIIDLHHDIIAFLIFISIFIVYMLLSTFNIFNVKDSRIVSLGRGYSTLSETIYVIFFITIFALIAVLSLGKLYTMEDISNPIITIRIIDRQWYWSYAYCGIKNRSSKISSLDLLDKLSNYDLLLDAGIFVNKYKLVSINIPLILPAETAVQFFITSTNSLYFWDIPVFGLNANIYTAGLNRIESNTGGRGVFYGQYSSQTSSTQGEFIPITIKVVRSLEFEWVILYGSEKAHKCVCDNIDKISFNNDRLIKKLKKRISLISANKIMNDWRKKNGYWVFYSTTGSHPLYYTKLYYGTQRADPIEDNSILSKNFTPFGIKTPFQYHFSHHLDDEQSNGHNSYQSVLTPIAFLTTPTAGVEVISRLDQFMLAIPSQYPEEFKNNQYGVQPPKRVSYKESIARILTEFSENPNVTVQENIYERKNNVSGKTQG